jgi:hypothetical protein
MHRWINIKRLTDAGIAAAPVGILVIGLALVLLKYWSLSPAATLPRIRAENQHDKVLMADELVAAIKNADEQAIGKWLDNGVDVNGRDAEGSNSRLVSRITSCSPTRLFPRSIPDPRLPSRLSEPRN